MRKEKTTLFLALVVLGSIFAVLTPAKPVHAAFISVLSPTSGAVGTRVDVNASLMYGFPCTYSIWFDIDGDSNLFESGENIKTGASTGLPISDFFIVPSCVGNRTGYPHIVIMNETTSGAWNTAYFSVVTSMKMSVPPLALVGDRVPINITINGGPASINYSLDVGLVDSNGNELASLLLIRKSDDRGSLSTIVYYPDSFSGVTSQPGNYTIVADVTDIPITGTGTLTTLYSGFFQVQPLPNQQPTAQIVSITPNPAFVGQIVSFTGIGSDTDGNITGYRWTSNASGVLSGSRTFSTSNLKIGYHIISFEVQDDAAAWSNLVSALLEVRQNQPPIAVIDSTLPSSIIVGQRLNLSGHGYDADGVIVSYSWTSSIDGLLSTSLEFSTSSLSVGSHIISFRVQDGIGAWSDEVTMVLEVREATTLFWLLPAVGGFALATAVFSLIHFSRPPSSTEVKKDLHKRQSKEAKKEEKEKQRGKRKTKRGEPFLDFETDSPSRIMGATSYEAGLRVRNIGSSEAKDVTVTADSTPGLLLDKQVEGISSLEPGRERTLVFPFRVSEQVRKGVYALRFEVRSKENLKQVRNRYARAVKIGLLSNAGRQEYVEPLREWLKGKSYTCDELTSADQLVKCLLKYDLIILAPELELPQQWMRNLALFVENSQSLLVIDKMITSEEKMLAKLLGYEEMRYETLKSDEGRLRICDNQHFVTRELAFGEGIQLEGLWGNMCVSKPSTGKSLIEHELGDEWKAVVPVLTVNEFMEGKTAHLNFHAEKSLSQLGLIVEKTLDWLLSEDTLTPPKPWSSGLRSLKLAPATLAELFQNISKRKH